MASIQEQINCVRREISMRENVFPRRVAAKSMAADEAEKETNHMKAVLRTLILLEKSGIELDPKVDGDLYNKCIARYDLFMREHKLAMKMHGGQGNAMKEIIKYLKKLKSNQTDPDPSDDAVYRMWDKILVSWDRLGAFLTKQKNLSQINKNIVEIIDVLRNGRSKKSKRQRHEPEQGRVFGDFNNTN